MLAVALTYGAVKKMSKSAPPAPPTVSSGMEYFVTIDINEATMSYNQAKSEYEIMDYKSSISHSYSSVKDVLAKILNYLNIQFPQDFNIVDMSFVIISKGIRLSFYESVEHMNSIRLRSIADLPVSKEEVLWMLTASKIILDSCKELPIKV
jgi:hypothetical protein